jgi:hypothetical protein
MAYGTWLSGKRAEIIEMAQGWNTHLNKPEVKALLNIPQADLEALATKTQLLATLNETPRGVRTPAYTAQIRTAEKDLVAKMSDIKMRHIFMPPLTEADLITLGLRPKDKTPTSVNPPEMTAECDLTFPVKGQVEVYNIRPVGNAKDARASYGTRIYYGIVGENDGDPARITNPPATGANLPQSVFTRKQKHCFDFHGERGKHAFFCLRYENSKGQPGPWGTLLEAYIP